MTKSDKLPTLETSLAEITQLMEKLEKSELTLEQSLTHFERGIVLIKHCQKILNEAEQKVQRLVQNHDQENLIDFEHEKSEILVHENAES